MLQNKTVHLAVDLGAGSGRVIAGVFEEGKISLKEIYRFENHPLEENGALFTDFESLWKEVTLGLKKASKYFGASIIKTLGVDSWGVDFGYVDAKGQLLKLPRQYRDPRNQKAFERLLERISPSEIFQETGIQMMEINSIVQHFAELEDMDGVVSRADQFLMIADLINYRLTGIAKCERTNASTTQLMRPKERDWSWKLFDSLGLPRRLAPELIDSGVVLGELQQSVAEITTLEPQTKVVAVGSHDTASAVAAVPAIHEARYAYLSSGTWSLLGVEVDEPDFGLLAQRLNLTNEAGVFGNIRLLKNINGLWLVQECRRAWREEGRDWSYQELSELVSKVTSPIALIDPDEQRFSLRGAMPQMICDYCSETGQIEPNGPGEILRVIEDSLALKVRHVLSLLEQTTGNRVEVLHVIGGGAQNEGLNQRICDCINRPVIVGPVEATAAGNVVMQLYADSKIKSLSEGRQLVAESFETQRYDPSEKSEWDKAYEFFTKLLKE